MIEPRNKKLILKYAIDLVRFIVCYALATLVYWIVSPEYELETLSLLYFGIYLVLFVLAYTIFGLERSIWRYFGVRDFVTAMLVHYSRVVYIP